jgi:hypothetical protein
MNLTSTTLSNLSFSAISSNALFHIESDLTLTLTHLNLSLFAGTIFNLNDKWSGALVMKEVIVRQSEMAEILKIGR